VWLTGGSHAQNFPPSKAPARPIGALGQGANTGLSALLLGSEKRQSYLRRAGVNPFSFPALNRYRAATRRARGDALTFSLIISPSFLCS
jgi:hypothetical protein